MTGMSWRFTIPHLLTALGLAGLTACADAVTAPSRPVTGPSAQIAVDSGLAPLLPAAPYARVVPNRYIVHLKSGVADVPTVARSLAAQYADSLHLTFTRALKGFSATVRGDRLSLLRRSPLVQFVSPVVLARKASGVQSNPPSNLDRIDQRNRPLDLAYHYSYDGTGVNIYIIDTGVMFQNNDFGGRVAGGYTVTPQDRLGYQDCNGHGTEVASAAAGTTYGVAKNATLYAVKIVFFCNDTTPSDFVVAGMDWVAQHAQAPAVANLSFIAPSDTGVNEAAQSLIAAGVSLTVAAGNDTLDACRNAPNGVPGVLTVAASDNLDNRANFSDYGPCVKLYAPGVGIPMATSDGFLSPRDYNATTVASGTSFASPQVAGVAALYLQQNPGATPYQVSDRLTAQATSGVIQQNVGTTPNLLVYSLVSP